MQVTRQVRVLRKSREAQAICSLELVSADQDPLQPFTAGSHIDVHLPNGLVRQYSLCNPPSEQGRYVMAVLRTADSRGGSLAVHDLIQPGDTLTISPPRNHFALVDGPHESLLMAGGIGVTPILSMAEALHAADRRFELHYCARSRAQAAFVDRLENGPYADRVRLHLDDGPASQRLDVEDVLTRSRDSSHLYLCGPQGFMDAILGAARRLGWDESRLHFEAFAARSSGAESSAFDVKLARSGRVVHVPSNKTVVQALDAAGVWVPTACEQGVCGTCQTKVLAGDPDHRDQVLTPEERERGDCFLPCCSRSKSGLLVLDL